MAVVSFRKELPPLLCFFRKATANAATVHGAAAVARWRRRRDGGERMLRLGCDCYCYCALPCLLLLRLLLPTPFLKLGGKQKALFKDSGLRTFPHAFDSLSSKPFIARQSKRSLPRRRRRADVYTLHSRSTVDRSTTYYVVTILYL